MIVRIVPLGGEPWVGQFAFGDVSPKAFTGILTTPNPNRLCVVARGNGYFVSANDQKCWSRVDCVPVMDAFCLSLRRLIVFSSFTDLVAYGDDGIAWKTNRISWDSLRISSVTDDEIIGEYFDIQTETIKQFFVDTRTGISQGGVGEI